LTSNKKIIGLTGLFCSGKSSAEKILAENYDYKIIDVDKLGHLALEKNKEKIINQFGSQIIVNEKIDRKVLGKIVFADKKKLAVLNSIVHPEMKLKVEELIYKSEESKICINAALLFEMGLYAYCSEIIIVKASICQILKRAKKRDGNSILKTLKILSSQKVLDFAKKKLKNAEIFYISNNRDFNNFKKVLDNFVKETSDE